MASDKNDYNKAYDEGYKAGKDGGLMDDFVHSNKDIIPFPDSSRTKSYDAGYGDGASDRHDSSNSHYSGGSSESSGCFITSAVIASLGKPDDCDELLTFRKFRDNWLINQPDGPIIISEYYKIAPAIVSAIDSQIDSTTFYKRLWQDKFLPCLNLIEQSRFSEAKTLYLEIVLDLKQDFIFSEN